MRHKTREWLRNLENYLSFEKLHEEFGEFWPNTWKSQTLPFNELLLTKVYNGWAKKLQSGYLPRHWRVMQYLKVN